MCSQSRPYAFGNGIDGTGPVNLQSGDAAFPKKLDDGPGSLGVFAKPHLDHLGRIKDAADERPAALWAYDQVFRFRKIWNRKTAEGTNAPVRIAEERFFLRYQENHRANRFLSVQFLKNRRELLGFKDRPRRSRK